MFPDFFWQLLHNKIMDGWFSAPTSFFYSFVFSRKLKRIRHEMKKFLMKNITKFLFGNVENPRNCRASLVPLWQVWVLILGSPHKCNFFLGKSKVQVKSVPSIFFWNLFLNLLIFLSHSLIVLPSFSVSLTRFISFSLKLYLVNLLGLVEIEIGRFEVVFKALALSLFLAKVNSRIRNPVHLESSSLR